MFNLNPLSIICSEVRIIDIEADVESKFYSDKFETDYKDNIEFEVAGNKSLLPGPCSAEHHVPKDTASMIEFNLIGSSPPAKPASATIDQGNLTSAAN